MLLVADLNSSEDAAEGCEQLLLETVVELAPGFGEGVEERVEH